MDVKHRTAYMRIKQHGVADEIVQNNGASISVLIRELMQHLILAPNRYGKISIEIDFTPFGKSMTQQERDYAEMVAGLDPLLIEMADEDEESPWDSNPMNPAFSGYDALYHEYQNCYVASHRAIKTPADLAILRKHMEDNYEDTRWWDGSHKW